MSFLFGGSSMPNRQVIAQPKQEDMTLSNAANAERLRRLRAFGFQKTIVTKEPSGGVVGLKSRLGQ